MIWRRRHVQNMQTGAGSCVLLLLAGFALTPEAFATQDRDKTGPPYSVQVELEYEIVIPRVLYFRVGTAGNTIDTVEFDVGQTLGAGNDMVKSTPGLPLGNGAPIAATSSNAGGQGVIPVEIRANVGNVSIHTTVSNAQGLVGDNGHFLNYDQIKTDSSDSASFPAPVLANSSIAPVAIAPSGFGGHVTIRNAEWTYTYLNQTTPAAGVYTGTVTYTATSP